MITKEDYFKGQHVHEDVARNANELLLRLERLLVYVKKDMPDFVANVSSGYRSPTHNATIKNAAPKSNHMSGKAVDIRDPRRRLAKWCVRNKARLEEQDLWCEDPRATVGWVHFQSTRPGSGNRFFIPSQKLAHLCQGPLTEESLS